MPPSSAWALRSHKVLKSYCHETESGDLIIIRATLLVLQVRQVRSKDLEKVGG